MIAGLVIAAALAGFGIWSAGRLVVRAAADEWLVHLRNGKVVRAGIGITAWCRPGDQAVRFTSTVQRVRFDCDVLDQDLLPVRLSAFALWSVDPDDPFLAYRRLGLGGFRRGGHLLERAQYHAFQQAFSALAQRHAGKWSLAALARDPTGLLAALQQDATTELASLGARIEDVQLLAVRPVSDAAFAALGAPGEEATRLSAERARVDTERTLDRLRADAEQERQAAADAALEAELAREQRRVDAEVAHVRQRSAAAGETPPEVRADQLARLRTEAMAGALGKLPLKEARWVSLQDPLDTVRTWLEG